MGKISSCTGRSDANLFLLLPNLLYQLQHVPMEVQLLPQREGILQLGVPIPADHERRVPGETRRWSPEAVGGDRHLPLLRRSILLYVHRGVINTRLSTCRESFLMSLMRRY